MTLQEAREREDYRFVTDYINYFINEIRAGKFSNWCEEAVINGNFIMGVVFMEIGYVDIELNIYTMCRDDGDGYTNKIKAAYFICMKGIDSGSEDWSDCGYIDDFGHVVNVDWNSDVYLEQLEEDMFNNLMWAVKEFNLKIDEPNWYGYKNAWDIYDSIHRINK